MRVKPHAIAESLLGNYHRRAHAGAACALDEVRHRSLRRPAQETHVCSNRSSHPAMKLFQWSLKMP
jgi:hypothetical protein